MRCMPGTFRKRAVADYAVSGAKGGNETMTAEKVPDPFSALGRVLLTGRPGRPANEKNRIVSPDKPDNRVAGGARKGWMCAIVITCGFRTRLVILGVAACIGVARALAFEDPALPSPSVLWALLFAAFFGLVLVPLAILAMVAIAQAIWRPAELTAVTWRTDFWQRLRAGDPLHAFHLVAWMAIVNVVTSLVTHYLCYGSLSVLTLFMAPAAIGVLGGTLLCSRLRGKDRAKG